MFTKKIKVLDFIDKVASHEIKVKQIIDVREKRELEKGKIAGSVNIPMDKLLADPERYLNKDETYYLMCQSGIRSKKVYKKLKNDFDVINVQAGYTGYSRFK